MHSIETKNLSKHFGGVYALKNVSLAFKRGFVTGLVGPNGSGKSTLVNVLTGMLPFDGGAVVFSGHDPLRVIHAAKMPELGVSRTFQEVRLLNQMTVLDNLLVVLTERGVFRSLFENASQTRLSFALSLLHEVGLSDKQHALAFNLSYGQRKLLEIARALALQSETLLFDEPFAGLFPQMVAAVSRIIGNLKAERKTVILIEHNMELIRELCDDLFVLDGGELLAHGAPLETLARKDVLEAYLGT